MTISITRVYTRTGDRGETALVGGKRVPKDSPRIAAYGTLDELNAVVGLVRVFNEERLAKNARHRRLDEVLRKIQNQLFDLGSELATPPDADYEGMFRVGDAEVDVAEHDVAVLEDARVERRVLAQRLHRGRADERVRRPELRPAEPRSG